MASLILIGTLSNVCW